jgi:DNA-binding LytR/AlgR family response regulator
MMNVLIVEDEKPALENLTDAIHQASEDIYIKGTATSVKTAIEWLQNNNMPELIFMDIQLSDGLSFNIFKNITISCPVIFVTAYDEYIMQGFENNGIDYLLKPISAERLKTAIGKYRNMQKHFLSNYEGLIEYLGKQQQQKRARILAKKGTEYHSLKLQEVVCFYTEHKITFLLDTHGIKFMVNKTLAELEDELDKEQFYRANRQYIVNANHIKRFRPIDKSKIHIELVIPVREEIIVSQENAGDFKKWMETI